LKQIPQLWVNSLVTVGTRGFRQLRLRGAEVVQFRVGGSSRPPYPHRTRQAVL